MTFVVLYKVIIRQRIEFVAVHNPQYCGTIKFIYSLNSFTMKKAITTPAAETSTANTDTVTTLVEKGNAKAKTAKADSKPADKKPKEKKITMASKLDELLQAGGKWNSLVEKANAESKALGKSLKYNVGTLKAHIRFRTIVQKNPDYLGNKKVTDEGIVVAKAKKAA